MGIGCSPKQPSALAWKGFASQRRSVCFVIPCAKYTGDRKRKYENGLGVAFAGGDLSKFVADDFVAPIGRIDRFNDGDEEAL